MSRIDLFTPIHKGIRSMIYKLGTELQTADFTDEEATKTMITKLEYNLSLAMSSTCILCMLHEHTGHEDKEVFPKVRAFEPAMVEMLAHEHQEVVLKLAALSKIGKEILETKDSIQRVELGIKLNHSANELFSYYLAHLAKEEVTILPATWQHFTDEELATIRATVDRKIPPDRYAQWMRWVLGSLNVHELIEMFAGLRKNSSPEFLENMVHIADIVVDKERWETVMTGVGNC